MYQRGLDGPMDDDTINDSVILFCLLVIIFIQMAVLGSPRYEAQSATTPEVVENSLTITD